VSHDLATLAADPTRVEDVSPDRLPALIGEAEALRARLWARLQAGAIHAAPAPAPDASGGPDRLLKAKDAAERLGVDVRWIYRQSKAGRLPFARKLSGGTLRFSERGMEQWQRRKAA
jgi:excisionase family DNA binding protein